MARLAIASPMPEPGDSGSVRCGPDEFTTFSSGNRVRWDLFMATLCVVLPAADRAQLAQVVANGNSSHKTGRAGPGQYPADAGRSHAPIAYGDPCGADQESRTLVAASL